ncbi:hypothetical protein THAOC_33053 [Thalassiosira oceanica]|uniref:Uncharacterized protein n=1 Tax=Thalassiosira oceanica TaxID=159749 RepID=K0R4T5_THAOC|nr:hypothetical protein THAOC_33053 [Thalassiosira oceanica]|eukprot:EJK48178.1 hypothetical protein THAOC_33053 [Thalassiosira oceanica]
MSQSTLSCPLYNCFPPDHSHSASTRATVVHTHLGRLVVHPALLDDLPHAPVVFPPVLVVQPAGLGVGRARRVGIAQQTLYAREYRANVVDRTPLVLQYVEADLPVVVYVRVEHLRQEPHGGSLVGVVLRELEGQFERPALPRRVVRAEDDRLPHHDRVGHGGARHARGRVILETAEVAEEASAGGRRHA